MRMARAPAECRADTSGTSWLFLVAKSSSPRIRARKISPDRRDSRANGVKRNFSESPQANASSRSTCPALRQRSGLERPLSRPLRSVVGSVLNSAISPSVAKPIACKGQLCRRQVAIKQFAHQIGANGAPARRSPPSHAADRIRGGCTARQLITKRPQSLDLPGQRRQSVMRPPRRRC